MRVVSIGTAAELKVVFNFEVDDAHTYFVGGLASWVHNNSVSGPAGRALAQFPRSTLRGVSLNWLKRNKPSGWREVPTRNREGWSWYDRNNVERLRFMRPNGKNPSASQWSRQSNGYFRWKDEAENHLDIDGRIVNQSHDKFQELTHIIYEGL